MPRNTHIAAAAGVIALSMAPAVSAYNADVEAARARGAIVSAQGGNPEAAYRLAIRYTEGRGVRQDREARRKWLVAAADLEHPQAAATLAVDLHQEGNHKAAARRARTAHKAGSVKGTGLLAEQYFTGKGVPKNYAKARQLARYAARRGDTRAMMVLARMLEAGNAGSRDLAGAFGWYRSAAEHGKHTAVLEVARFLSQGIGRDPDPRAAMSWYRRGAAQEIPEAMFRLGELYATEEALADGGRGKEKALEWLSQAVGYGHPGAEALIAKVKSGTVQPEPVEQGRQVAETAPASKAANVRIAGSGRAADRPAPAPRREEPKTPLPESTAKVAAELRQVRADLSETHEKLEWLRASREKALEEIALLREETRDLYDENHGLEGRVASLRQKVSEYEQRIASLRSFKDRIEAERAAERERRLAEERRRQKARQERLAHAAKINQQGLAAAEDHRYVAAIRKFREAADLGSTNAMQSLAYLYENGLGALPSQAEARKWRQRAAEAERTAQGTTRPPSSPEAPDKAIATPSSESPNTSDGIANSRFLNPHSAIGPQSSD